MEENKTVEKRREQKRRGKERTEEEKSHVTLKSVCHLFLLHTLAPSL